MCSHLVRRTAQGQSRCRQEVETAAPAKPPRAGQSRRGQAARAHKDSLNRRKSDAVRTRPLVPPSQYALQNLKAHLSSTCFLFLGSKAAPENGVGSLAATGP